MLITSRGLPLQINYLRLTIDSIKQRLASVTIDYLLVTTRLFSFLFVSPRLKLRSVPFAPMDMLDENDALLELLETDVCAATEIDSSVCDSQLTSPRTDDEEDVVGHHVVFGADCVADINGCQCIEEARALYKATDEKLSVGAYAWDMYHHWLSQDHLLRTMGKPYAEIYSNSCDFVSQIESVFKIGITEDPFSRWCRADLDCQGRPVGYGPLGFHCMTLLYVAKESKGNFGSGTMEDALIQYCWDRGMSGCLNKRQGLLGASIGFPHFTYVVY